MCSAKAVLLFLSLPFSHWRPLKKNKKKKIKRKQTMSESNNDWKECVVGRICRRGNLSTWSTSGVELSSGQKQKRHRATRTCARGATRVLARVEILRRPTYFVIVCWYLWPHLWGLIPRHRLPPPISSKSHAIGGRDRFALFRENPQVIPDRVTLDDLSNIFQSGSPYRGARSSSTRMHELV